MKYYIANWKMKMNSNEVEDWATTWTKKDTTKLAGEIILAPTFLHLHLLKSLNTSLAAQDIAPYERGAHTGYVGAFQIKEYADYCIVGHSEREESHNLVMKKANTCLEHGITPIICFVDAAQSKDYYIEGAILAWEDPENISKGGTYNPADTQEIENNLKLIKSSLPEKAEVLYGGSVNKQNIQDLENIEYLDGVLVGSASLDPDHFYEICKHS